MFPAHRKAGVHARRTAAISKPGKPGRSCRRKVRRDEGIPPYVCPEGRGRPVWPGACRGSQGRATALPHPPRRRKLAGPMRASDPTGVCYNAEGAASRSAACPPLAVGADSISARGVCGGAGLPGRYRIGPYRGLLYRGGAASRLAAVFPVFRRAGIYARRTAASSKPGRSCRRKVRRDEGIPPYVCPEGRGRPVWPGACRGSQGRATALPHPPRRRKLAGPMRASDPTGVCYNAEGAASRSAACPPLAVGADSISARGVCGGAGLPGRYRIGPYRGLLYRGGAASRLAAVFPVFRRAGIYARRTAASSKPGRSCRRKVRRDEGIPPHACPEGRARPVWPGACRGL